MVLYFVSVNYGHATASNITIYTFVASVAGITADKFASEFGVLDGDPIMLMTGKKAKKGTSGAVTWLGFAMGSVASGLVALTVFSYPLTNDFLSRPARVASADSIRKSTSTARKNHHMSNPKNITDAPKRTARRVPLRSRVNNDSMTLY